MQKFIFMFLLLTGIQAVGIAQGTDKKQIKNLESQFDQLIRQYLDLDIFSGVVLVAEDGVPVYHKAFGLANRETGEKNTVNTLFNIGSMNKTFTDVVIYQLIREGKLGLQDKLTSYIKGFADPDAGKITIAHLLNHESGLGDYHGPMYFDLPAEQKTIGTITEMVKKMPLEFEPGTQQRYSNAGYVVLGAVIEKITGEPYTANVRKRIAEPLGLKNTHLENTENLPLQSVGYLKTIFGELEDNRMFASPPKPDGGFWATTADVLEFYREYHYGNRLLDENDKAAIEFFAHFEKLKTMGDKATGHAGGFNGANTVILEIPGRKLSLLVFANMDEPVAEQIAKGMLSVIRGETPPKASLPAARNVWQAWEKYGRAYVKENFETLTVNFHPQDPKDLILNQVGYGLLAHDQPETAIQVFELNTELFPDVANCWDSLGEAWLAKGDQKKALTCYKKALQMDPEMPTAKEMVEKLEKKH